MSERIQGNNRRLAKVESQNLTLMTDDFPIYWEKAQGSEIWDSEGKRYIDFSSAFGVASIGHSHPTLVDAISDQAGKLIHGMGDIFPAEIKIDFLEKLTSLFGEDCKAILSLTGTEAVESSLKTALMFTKRPGIVSFEGAYHGLGYGALTLTHRPHFTAHFQEQISGHVLHVPFPDASADDAQEQKATSLRALTTALNEGGVGAVIIEPIQGRGGIVIPPEGFLTEMSDIAHSYGAVLIFDEVMTGFGRTGNMFAFEHEGIRPDIMAVGKALGGGIPVSACLAKTKVMDSWPLTRGEAIHTSTFNGHPLACRSAFEVLNIIEKEDLVAESVRKGKIIRDYFASYKIRGRGMMWGIVMENETVAKATASAALDDGLIVLLDGDRMDVIAIMPPLNISDELLMEGLKILDKALG